MTFSRVLAGEQSWHIEVCDVLDGLRALPDGCVQTIVTSPPYWGLRDYGVDGAIGLEATPDEYVARIVEVFGEGRRVLRDDGTLWLNLGDSYSHGGNGSRDPGLWPKQSRNAHGFRSKHAKAASGVKPKDLVGMPWRVALALQADGWWLRQEVTWCKPSAMPESVTDRPTCATEKVFLLAKQARYFYDADAVRTPLADKTYTTYGTSHRAQGNDALGLNKSDNWGRSVAERKPRLKDKQRGHSKRYAGFNDRWDAMSRDEQQEAGANLRNWWVIASEGFSEAHFATFPKALVLPCIKAGSREGDVVLDPFAGAGTTGIVARKLERRFVGIELNPGYVEMARKRIEREAPPTLWEAR